MTKVYINKEKGFIKSFTLMGHAGYNNSGPDIVCAAVSTASQMTIIGLESVANAKFTSVCTTPGLMKIELNEESNERANTLMETLELTLLTLSSQYPQNVQVYSC